MCSKLGLSWERMYVGVRVRVKRHGRFWGSIKAWPIFRFLLYWMRFVYIFARNKDLVSKGLKTGTSGSCVFLYKKRFN